MSRSLVLNHTFLKIALIIEAIFSYVCFISEEGGSSLSTIKMNYTNPLFCKNYIV